MNILFAASELVPYAKTGGLGDVLAALPAALRQRGHSVSCVLPLYRDVAAQLPNRRPSILRLTIPLGTSTRTAEVTEVKTPQGITLFLIEADEFFDRTRLYGTEAGDYADNAARFIFFSKVVVELARHVQPKVDILHLHDWQTGLVPAMVRAAGWSFRTVYTIHNLAYQGAFPAQDFDLCNLPAEYFSPPGVEFYQRLNCMKAGIVLADQITTVSPRYAEEIQTPEFGCGLDIVLQEHRAKLTGILNGVDDGVWSPEQDPHLKATYSVRRLAGKDTCKQAILQRFGLRPTEAPLFGVVSRLVGQKGFDLLAETLEDWLREEVRLVVLGAGEAVFEDYFQRLTRLYPDKVGVQIGFDDALAHQIEAGADFFLMPSRFEPCGLNQMYSLRYGTLPIVHDTGGLSDSVVDAAEIGGTGFKFTHYTVADLQTTLQRAGLVYQDKKKFLALRREAMKQRFSWERSAKRYEAVYAKALATAA